MALSLPFECGREMGMRSSERGSNRVGQRGCGERSVLSWFPPESLGLLLMPWDRCTRKGWEILICVPWSVRDE